MNKIRGAIAVAGLCILFVFTSARLPSISANSDFFTFWLAGRMTLHGEDAYVAEEWLAARAAHSATWMPEETFIYPHPTAIALMPLGMLRLKTAYRVWVWLTQVLLLVVVVMLLPQFGEERKHYIVPLVAGIILFRPIVSLLINGQLSAFFLAVIVLAGVLWNQQRWLWGGLVGGLMLLKPSLGIPILTLVGLYMLVRKHYHTLAGLALTATALMLVGMVHSPNWISEYLNILQVKQAETFGYSPTVWGLAGLVGGFNRQVIVGLGAGLSAGLLVLYGYLTTKLKGLTPLVGVSMAVAVALSITPYIWPYDQLLLILPIVVLMALLKDRQVSYLGVALVFILIDVLAYTLLWFSVPLANETLSGLIPLLVSGLLGGLLVRYRSIFAKPAASTAQDDTV